MKKKHLLLDFFEFSLIFFTFILPSLLISRQNTVTLNINYSFLTIFIRLLVIIYLIMRMYDSDVYYRLRPHFSLFPLLRLILKSINIYIILFLISMVSSYYSQRIEQLPPVILGDIPSTLSSLLWFCFSVITLACFEELLFRQFLPEKLVYFFKIFSNNNNAINHANKAFRLLIECLCFILFALAHVYLGIISVFSALLSAIVLRLSVIYCKTIVPACIAHSINNLVSFYFIFHSF